MVQGRANGVFKQTVSERKYIMGSARQMQWVILSEQHVVGFIFCHGTQTMHVALTMGFVSPCSYTGIG